MKKNNQPEMFPPADAVELAKKKRREYLLNKVKKNKRLTENEIKELQKYGESVAPPGTVETQQDVARFFQVSVRTVQYWIKDDAPVREDGRYDLRKLMEWKDQRDKELPGGATPEANNWKSQSEEYKAKKLELDYKERLGQLVRIEDVSKEAFEMARKLRDNFLRMPDRIARDLAIETDHVKISNILANEIRQILEDLK